MEDLSVRAIPQLDLVLIGENTDTVRITTDLDGAAEVRLRPGTWKVQSAAPFTYADYELVWSQEVRVVPGEGGRVDLTNRNATAPGGRPLAPTSRARPASRRVSEEAAIFEGVKSGVFTVFSDEGKGSGFLADPSGLVLTNAHVVRNATEVRVQIDSATVIRAAILSNDPERDVAVLAIAPGRCTVCVTLPLADPRAGPLAVTGERILAIGSPLNQAAVLTLGIVSRLEERAIISDVNINHGNSGGPMLNAAGEVIGINTFGDMSAQGGPGISGAITITQALPALDRARSLMASGAAPAVSDALMPMLSREAYPLAPLREAASQRRFNLRPYSRNVGGFDVLIMTPPAMAWRQAQADEALLQRRRQRETRAGVAESERVDPVQNWAEWSEYVGERKAAVVFYALPEVGETRGSAFANVLGAMAAGMAGTYYSGRQTLEFKGDFRSMTLYRDGVEVSPVSRNRSPAVLDVSAYQAEGKDFAYQGIYAYRPDDFAPNNDGSFPTFRVQIEDTAHPGSEIAYDLPARTVEAIWRDFAPMRQDGVSSSSR